LEFYLKTKENNGEPVKDIAEKLGPNGGHNISMEKSQRVLSQFELFTKRLQARS